MKGTARSTEVKKIFQNQKLRGKHIIAVGEHVFTARTGKEAVSLFHKVTKQYPGKKLTVTYIPKAESLILIVCH